MSWYDSEWRYNETETSQASVYSRKTRKSLTADRPVLSWKAQYNGMSIINMIKSCTLASVQKDESTEPETSWKPMP